MQFMQQTFRKDRNDRAPAPAITSPDAGYELNVAVVYQDALTRQWAGQVRELMAGVVGQDAIRCTSGTSMISSNHELFGMVWQLWRTPTQLWFHCMRRTDCQPHFTCGSTFGYKSVACARECWSPCSSRSKNRPPRRLKRDGTCPQSPARVAWSFSCRNATSQANQSLISGKTLCSGLKQLECRFPVRGGFTIWLYFLR